MNNGAGKYIIIAGSFIVIIGIVIYFFPGAFRWMGRLPGDIRMEKGNSRFYFPIVTMILVSIVLTILINLFRRFL
ncbi:MAG TPA: DUF2905 domain-containing protein [Ferruginibacter sp.]|nr:DUF2905 domain-containing protein [Ferruginibacter sp.]